MGKVYRANGKILITGEYFVLDGARALVVPLKYGQTLEVISNKNDNCIDWNSYEKGNCWFSATFLKNNLSLLSTTDNTIAQKLKEILSSIKQLNPDIFAGSAGISFQTELEFNRNYGWGSSSTLIAVLAKWATIDSFNLHFSVSNGSGYDIAAANSEGPVVFSYSDEIPEYREVDFSPSFADKLYLVFLGKKQNSSEEVNYYRTLPRPKKETISLVSEITNSMIHSTDLPEFEALLGEHEKIVSEYMGRPALKDSLFADYRGSIKSLGAWGGDFALFTSREGEEHLAKYINLKGLNEYYRFNDLVLKRVIAPKSSHARV